jgi:SAM-dependent methyltransferase
MSGDPPDPSAVWGVIHGASQHAAVVAAIRLGLFEALGSKGATTDELAAPLELVPARLEALLEVLATTPLVARGAGTWRSTPTSERFLRRSSPATMVDLVEWSRGWPENWEQLEATVQGRQPPHPVDRDAGFYVRLAEATFPTQLAVAQAAVSSLGDLGERARVLDVGAGLGPWSIALLSAFPDAVATVSDLDGVMALARGATERHGIAERCAFLAGDYLSVDFGVETYDVAVLGHVCRAEAPDRVVALLERVAVAVAPGGQVVLTDYLVDDDRSGPPSAQQLGLTMVANTRGGRAYTRGEVTAWLLQAGLEDVTSVRPLPYAEVVLARKPAREDEAR